jgi:hypothetical protein
MADQAQTKEGGLRLISAMVPSEVLPIANQGGYIQGTNWRS